MTIRIGRNSLEQRRWYKVNKDSYLVLVITLLIGVCIGWLAYMLLGDISSRCKILYVSKQQIMQYEKERTRQQSELIREQDNDLSTKDHSQIPVKLSKADQMFYGRINEAIELMEQIAKNYENNVTKVIFTGDSFVAGKNIQSISQQVYEQTVKQLQRRYYENKTE